MTWWMNSILRRITCFDMMDEAKLLGSQGNKQIQKEGKRKKTKKSGTQPFRDILSGVYRTSALRK